MRRLVRSFALLGLLAALTLVGTVNAAPAPERRYFPETGHYVQGAFLSFFDSTGSLDVFGYPRTEEFQEGGRTVQYFQRARMEWWPENQAPFDVQLGLMGDLVFGPDSKASPPEDPNTVPKGAVYFPETGHTLSGPFLEFFNSHGGLMVFGYPTSQPYKDCKFNKDNICVETDRTLQTFQRGRMETWPDHKPPYDVQLTLVGDMYIFDQHKIPLDLTRPVSASANVVSAPAGAGRIAFVMPPDNVIYVVNGDGSDMHQYANGTDPAWSPDGSRLAFVVRGGNDPGVHIKNADGSEMVAAQVERASTPVWSPDGKKIAFTSEVSGYGYDFLGRPKVSDQTLSKLMVVNLDNGEIFETPAENVSFTPTWSPDGQWIAYKSARGIRVMSADYSSDKLITPEAKDAPDRVPTWSPDGSRILFTYLQHDHWQLAVVNPDGGAWQQLTVDAGPFSATYSNVAPAWSPDGKQVVFLSDREGVWKMYVMNADGSNQRKFLDLPLEYRSMPERLISWGK